MHCPLLLHLIWKFILCHIFISFAKCVGGGGVILEISQKTINLGLKVLVLKMFLDTLSSSRSLIGTWLVGWSVSWSVGLLVSLLDTFVKKWQFLWNIFFDEKNKTNIFCTKFFWQSQYFDKIKFVTKRSLWQKNKNIN